MLSDLLGDSFGPDNWTSEARGIVDGFTPFEGSSLGDFTYHDQDGILTRIWYDGDSAVLEAWEGKWPTYHIEVKSTAGTAQDPFQISRHQLDIVSFSLPLVCFIVAESSLGFEPNGTRGCCQSAERCLCPHSCMGRAQAFFDVLCRLCRSLQKALRWRTEVSL